MKRDKNGRFSGKNADPAGKKAEKKRPATAKRPPKKKEARFVQHLPPHMQQCDSVSCGVYATTWALRVLGFDACVEGVRAALHTDRVPRYAKVLARVFKFDPDDFKGTLPTSVIRVMFDAGFLPSISGALTGKYVEKSIRNGGVLLVGYYDGSVGHWIAVAKEAGNGLVAVMDPVKGKMLYGREAVEHEAFGSVRARIMLGFHKP